MSEETRARWRIIEGDCREALRELPDESVQCCVTSPPYWGLRDYGNEGQLGLEDSLDEYVGALVAVFRDVRRVLAGDGTLWLNLGDGYAHGGNGSRDPDLWPKQSRNDHRVQHSKRTPGEGIKPKDLLGLPWLVAFALRADGWWLRSEVIWDKPNGMPESASDRPAKHHEQVFLLAKSHRYFYDRHGFREDDCGRPSGNGFEGRQGHSRTSPISGGPGGPAWQPGNGRNLRSVWRIPVRPFPECALRDVPGRSSRALRGGELATGRHDSRPIRRRGYYRPRRPPSWPQFRRRRAQPGIRRDGPQQDHRRRAPAQFVHRGGSMTVNLNPGVYLSEQKGRRVPDGQWFELRDRGELEPGDYGLVTGEEPRTFTILIDGRSGHADVLSEKAVATRRGDPPVPPWELVEVVERSLVGWHARCPNGVDVNLSPCHPVTLQEDGTVSVSGSILAEHPSGRASDSYNGYLCRGVWRLA